MTGANVPTFSSGDQIDGQPLPPINVVTLHPPGDARVYTRQALSLAKYSDTVTLISPEQPGFTPQSERVGHRFIKRGSHRLIVFLVMPWKLLLASLKQPAKIIYIHDAVLLYLFPIYRLFGKICVYDRHEDYGNMVSSRHWIPKPLRKPSGRIVDFLERFFARFSHGIVSVVHPLEQIVPAKPSLVLHNFPGEEIIRTGSEAGTPASQREFDLVHLGSMSNTRFPYFLKIIKGLIEHRPTIRILVIGSSDQHYQVLTDTFDRKNVSVFKKIPHTEVTGKLSQCKVGIAIFPILQPHLQWAVPVKLFEYMACGCSFLTSHMPGFESLLREADKKDVHIIDSAEPEPYIREIEAMLDNPVELDRQSALYRQWISDYYNWRHEETKLYRFFSELSK